MSQSSSLLGEFVTLRQRDLLQLEDSSSRQSSHRKKERGRMPVGLSGGVTREISSRISR